MNRRAGWRALLLCVAAMQANAQIHSVVVRPEPIDDVLVNPGMGITTFQRFNGQELNSPYVWSERGPLHAQPDAPSKPVYPETSIAYLRWYWSALEPEPGKYRWEILDSALGEARKHHQTLAIRLMPYSNKDPLPVWFQHSGARRANKPTDKDGAIWQPDFSDPLFLRHWGALVAEAGRRYDGNPLLDSVDISSVGYWGEGWSNYMPPFSAQQPLIDIWLKSFQKTRLLINFDEPEALAYGTQHGAGWRLDCLGDMRPKQPEMLDIYPQQVVRTGIQDVWEHAPVSLETCDTPAGWLRDGYDVNYILSQALRWHISSLNVKSSPLPTVWKKEFEDFQKQMGYRFLLRRFEYPAEAKSGMDLPIQMWWLNAGVAPVYKRYRLALALESGRAKILVPISADVTKWLPGDAVVDQSIHLPSSLSPGTYQWLVALLDPETNQPAIRLAIKGRRSDGWYAVGTLTVKP